jgi:hypothetical protein
MYGPLTCMDHLHVWTTYMYGPLTCMDHLPTTIVCMSLMHIWYCSFTEIRKLKAQLAAPLDFDDASNDVNADTASEVSVRKVSTYKLSVCLSAWLSVCNCFGY